MAFPILAAALIGGGMLGAASQKRPKYNMAAMDEAYKMISDQYENINKYFTEANTSLDTQFGGLYSRTMQDSISSLAGSGVYESPVSEQMLQRTRTGLAETYASAKSQLAGQKIQAVGGIDSQRIAYLQNLAQVQYNKQLMKQQQKAQMFSMMGGLGSALMGVK